MVVDALQDPMVVDTPQDPMVIDAPQDSMDIDAGSHDDPGHDLGVLAVELERRSRQLVLAVGLVFTTPPTPEAPTPELPAMDPNDLRLYKLSLAPNEPVNTPISEYERWLFMAKKKALWVADDGAASDSLLADIEKEFRDLQCHKVDEWRRAQEGAYIRKRLEIFSGSLVRPSASTSVETSMRSRSRPRVGTYSPPANFFWRSPLSIEQPTLACYILMAILHLICGLSLDDCVFFLPSIELVLRLGFERVGCVESQLKLPRDPRTVLETLKLKPDVQSYICCPKCFALYPFGAGMSGYCSFKETPADEPCGEPLFRPRRVGATTRSVPIREYFHQSLAVWLGKLLCRPGTEEVLDRDVLAEGSSDSLIDIFSGDVLRHFPGHDGSLFLPSRNSEGRYVLGLSVDAFNPFLNKQAGKKASVTAIYMVLLNLPPSSRYKVENMYLAGVIPGPQEPSLTQINHLLRPLIDELLEFWDPGVWYTRTPHCPSGKLIRAALVPLICDLKAARQVMGHGSHSAKKFCSICSLSLERRNDLGESSRVSVPAERFRQHALEWKNALSRSERERLFRQHGIRWSILLELPYWDPPRFTIVDSMHTILLGHIHRHCTIIWGMNPTRMGGSDGRRATSSPSHQAIISAAWTIRSGSVVDVTSLETSLLREFCLQNDLISHNLVMNPDAREIRRLVLDYVSAFPSDLKMSSDDRVKRVERGWFTRADQDKPKGTLDFLSKVECVPKSII